MRAKTGKKEVDDDHHDMKNCDKQAWWSRRRGRLEMFLRASARSPRGKITVVAASYLDICVLDDETITGPAHTHREREREAMKPSLFVTQCCVVTVAPLVGDQ